MEENIVLVEGRLSIREEDENITIIASKILPFGTFLNGESVTFGTSENNINRKVLEINVTNLTEEQKGRLRGTIKFFAGDKNNTQLQIINGDKTIPSGGIFINEAIFKEFKEIAGEENCKW